MSPDDQESAGSEAESRSLSRPPSLGMYERILEAAADAIVTVNEAQEIVHFNRGAEHIFGYEKAEVLGSKLNRLLPAQFRAHHAEYVEAFGRSAESARLMGHRREVFGLRKDGTEFPAEASILKLDAPDGRRLYTALVRDVTDRKKLEQQQQFLADVSVALSGSLDYDSTLDSVIRLPIPALGDLCVLELSDESGRTRRVFPVSGVDETGSVTRTLSLVARGETVGRLMLTRSRTRSAFDQSDQLIAENFAARAALAIDNARLYHDAQRATRARDEVLGVVSHDLRNPLSAIAMCSRVLVDNPPADAGARRELARTIHESTSWMSRMIQDLLDVSAIEAGVLSLIRTSEKIAPILTRVTELFTRAAADRGVNLTLNVDPHLPPVRADAERLVQAVANLVGNAVKFTGAGGRVTIAASAKTDEVEIVVADTGRGIAEQDLPHIFDRYWHSRSAAAGTGLGLAIARGIVEAHDGRITVRSELGAGTQFSILIPWEGRDGATATMN